MALPLHNYSVLYIGECWSLWASGSNHADNTISATFAHILPTINIIHNYLHYLSWLPIIFKVLFSKYLNNIRFGAFNGGFRSSTLFLYFNDIEFGRFHRDFQGISSEVYNIS